MIEFTIPVAPVTKKNHQQIVKANGRLLVVPSKQYRQYEADCGMFLKALGINGRVNIKALYYMPTRRRVALTEQSAIHSRESIPLSVG